MKHARTFFFLLIILAMTSCKNDSHEDATTLTTKATLLWTGEIAADGCGFEVLIDGKKYLPEDENAIPAVYKESESSEVKLTYIPLEEPIDRRCGMLPQPRVMDAIRIVSVKAL